MNKFKGIFKYGMKFVSKKEFALLLVVSFFTLVVSLPIPIFQQYLIDNIFTKNFNILIIVGIIMFFLSLMQIFLGIFFNYKYSIFNIKTIFKSRKSILSKIFRLEYNEIKKYNSAYLVNRVYSDTEQVTGFVLNFLINISSSSIKFIYGVVLISVISYQVLIIIVLLVVFWITTYNVFEKILYKYNFEVKESSANLYSKANETVNMIDYIIKNNSYEIENSLLKNLFLKMLTSYKRFTKTYSVFTSISSSINLVVSCILICFGVIQIHNKNMTLGQLIALNTSTNFVLSPIQSFLASFNEYPNCKVSYNRICEIMDMPEYVDGESEIEEINSVEMRGITFSYDDNKLLSDISYKFDKGNVYAIYGKNGSGKTTLVKILLKLYEIQEGNIIINNTIDIKDVKRESLLNKVGIVDQEQRLFNDTIYNNIVYNNNAMEYELDEVIKFIGIEEFIKSLKCGMDTVVGENSYNISGGQKQKISLCKALLKRTDLIILDEPTSALDSISIKKLSELLSIIKKDKIIFLISHNKDIIDIADYSIRL